MIVKPRIRGFVCTTAHPLGCEVNVKRQVEYVNNRGTIDGPKRVLVIGASTGYGLASRITAAFGSQAATVGLFFERPPSEKRTASAGWYNSVAFENAAHAAGLYAKSINGDAFSDEIRQQTCALLKDDLGTIDLLVYSLASPRRTHPKTGRVAKSVLKPIEQSYTGRTLDTDKHLVKAVSLDPATEEEIADTVSVMGGEDWGMWIEALDEADLLAPRFHTVAYTYIGTKLTWPIYWDGTIGRAKMDLDRTAKKLNERLRSHDGVAFVSVMKALVTQSSSAIPVVPLYISLLYKVMKEKGGHEGCIQQIQRLFATRLYADGPTQTDEHGYIRMDDLEMRREIQEAIEEVWPRVATENLDRLTDFAGYRAEFLKLFGFGFESVDYDADVDAMPAAGF